MHNGTLRHIFGLALAMQLACSDDSEHSDLACTSRSECAIVSRDCCGNGSDQLDGVYAARADSVDAKQGPAQCRGKVFNCPVMGERVFDPLAAKLQAACIANQCTVVDLRKDEASRCTQDSDCHTESTGCCPPCASDPSLYASVNTAGASLLACFPIPPCDACISSSEPKSYCAVDGHCALKP